MKGQQPQPWPHIGSPMDTVRRSFGIRDPARYSTFTIREPSQDISKEVASPKDLYDEHLGAESRLPTVTKHYKNAKARELPVDKNIRGLRTSACVTSSKPPAAIAFSEEHADAYWQPNEDDRHHDPYRSSPDAPSHDESNTTTAVNLFMANSHTPTSPRPSTTSPGLDQTILPTPDSPSIEASASLLTTTPIRGLNPLSTARLGCLHGVDTNIDFSELRKAAREIRRHSKENKVRAERDFWTLAQREAVGGLEREVEQGETETLAEGVWGGGHSGGWACRGGCADG